MRIKRDRYWSLHTHSVFSNNDAMTPVADLVDRAVELGYPALGIQDHGNMAASVQLYKACHKAGIAPFPGTEFYMVPSIEQHRYERSRKDGVKAARFHLGITAFTTAGYQNLVALNTLAHQNHFHKPLLDFDDLAMFSDLDKLDGLAVNTGCHFGYLTQQLTTYGEDAALQWLKTLDSWFSGRTYVELQNHNITQDGWSDDQVAETLSDLAHQTGLPTVITQDSHYLHLDERQAHESLKRLVAYGTDPDDAVFPGDGFHLADQAWMSDHHPPPRLERGCEGLSHLLDAHALSIPVLDTYHYKVPELVTSPQVVLGKRCHTALKTRELTAPRYIDRFTAELDVIKASEMAGYLLLSAEICDYMRENNIKYQTRGSAAGSLVCYLLGISNVDPLVWDLRFERFLSKDRTKPPDIDLDIQHDRRADVIAWLRTKYSVHQISTWMQYSLEGDTEASSGSLRVKYFTASAKRGGASDWREVPEADKRQLFDLDRRKLYSGLGKNAAGVVITQTTADFTDIVPLHHMASGESVAQYNKNDLESLGLVKLDVLGSKTLTILAITEQLVGSLRVDAVPLNDRETLKFIRTAATDGIFQLEGGVTKRGLRDLKPTTVKHLIAAMALFRPAVMQSGSTNAYCRRKNKEEPLPDRHTMIMKITKDTMGIVLYQEQVMDLMRALGMGVEDLNRFLSAVKASNKDIGGAGVIINEYLEWIDQRGDMHGFSTTDREYIHDVIKQFEAYSFNRAHATVYGLTSYQCAYLAVHHPLEFHTALLQVAAGDPIKEPKYVRATRRRGIKIRQPSINHSGVSYTLDERHQSIRKGLTSIKGVGTAAATELVAHQPYRDLEDLCERVTPRSVSGAKTFNVTKNRDDIVGVIQKLLDSEALSLIL